MSQSAGRKSCDVACYFNTLTQILTMQCNFTPFQKMLHQGQTRDFITVENNFCHANCILLFFFASIFAYLFLYKPYLFIKPLIKVL